MWAVLEPVPAMTTIDTARMPTTTDAIASQAPKQPGLSGSAAAAPLVGATTGCALRVNSCPQLHDIAVGGDTEPHPGHSRDFLAREHPSQNFHFESLIFLQEGQTQSLPMRAAYACQPANEHGVGPCSRSVAAGLTEIHFRRDHR